MLEAFGTDSSEVDAARMMLSEIDTHSIYSTPLHPTSELFQPVADTLKDVLSIQEVRGSIDFAEFGDKYLIFSYHERAKQGAQAMLQNLLQNELKILDKEKNTIVFSETLNTETPFPIPDNFFINHGILIYVKDKRELTAVSLN